MTQPWRLFVVEVCRLRRLSPTFLRVSVTGPELDAFADNGFDQRFKLVFPLPGRGLADLPSGPDWYQRWRALPDGRRNPIRTYTVRQVRRAAREVDVDMVCHGTDSGPAARWAATARPGTRLGLIGPDAGYPGEHGGVEFRPPIATGAVLLAGDETAVPAVMAILERMPRTLAGEALLEVPHPADALTAAAPPPVRVSWLPRSGAPPGSRLAPAVTAAAGRMPEPGLYAWLAGEAGVVRALRRHLVTDRGLDRGSVTFMGYWRRGHAEGEEQ
jgi:NADPH-dependent ferric siderophore reductase